MELLEFFVMMLLVDEKVCEVIIVGCVFFFFGIECIVLLWFDCNKIFL